LPDGFIVELSCPVHGLERYKIKIIRKYNVPGQTITPQFNRRPTPGELSSVVVGKNVSEKDIETYVRNYLQNMGLWSAVLHMRFTT
jgi:hypothetical protein